MTSGIKAAMEGNFTGVTGQRQEFDPELQPFPRKENLQSLQNVCYRF